MDIVLIAGLWLPAATWDDVIAELDDRGHRGVAVELPGVDDGDPDATLDDQLAAVLAAVDGAERPVVVGHSAAATLAWLAADRRPDDVARVVLIGGFPAGPGSAYADFLPIADGVMAFPGWEPFEGPDSDDLDESTRASFEAAAVAVPEGVATATVELTDERRRSVPVTLICPEFSPDDARGWIDDGDLPELAAAEHLDLVDLDSGHWPQLTRPADLARLLADAADA